MKEMSIATDVLVVGGGMAGCFAAIKAREQGRQVVLVDADRRRAEGEVPRGGVADSTASRTVVPRCVHVLCCHPIPHGSTGPRRCRIYQI